jgi:broad specificity phosphatase PhoE
MAKRMRATITDARILASGSIALGGDLHGYGICGSRKPTRAAHIAKAGTSAMTPPDATTILLVRHGHVPGISPLRFRGRADIALSEIGVEEAHKTALWIARYWQPTIVYTSPMQRCRDTGAEIARRCNVSTEVLQSLNDLDYGDWQWQTHEAIAAKSPDLYRRWQARPELTRFPNGESLQELAARVADALRFSIERHPIETIVMVGHESVNRALLLQIMDQPLSSYWKFSQHPCAINEFVISADGVRVIRINESAHLQS